MKRMVLLLALVGVACLEPDPTEQTPEEHEETLVVTFGSYHIHRVVDPTTDVACYVQVRHSTAFGRGISCVALPQDSAEDGS